MPGICGILSTTPGLADAVRLDPMVDALQTAPWQKRSVVVNRHECVALGRVHLGHSSLARTFSHDNGYNHVVVLDGELYDTSKLLTACTRPAHPIDPDNHAEILLHGFLQGGRSFLRQVHGSFAAAIWSGETRRLLLLTDRFGTRPLYYVHEPHGLCFSTGLRSLLRALPGDVRISQQGLAQFFTFGYYLGDDTSIENVRVLPAAACFEYDAASGEFVHACYWNLAEAHVEHAQDRRETLEQIDKAFTAAVVRRTANTAHMGLSLSGGLDGRTILGVTPGPPASLKAVCVGIRDSLDHRSSERLAKLAGCPYHAYVLDASFLKSFRAYLDQMVLLTDGQYLSQCIVMPTLALYRDLDIHRLLRGHGGELMHMRKAYNYSIDGEAQRIRTDQDLRRWLLRKMPAYMLEGVDGALFTPTYQEGLRELAEQALDRDLEQSKCIRAPLQRTWYLFVSQRLRREVPLSLLKFRSVVEPRLPYLDNDLIPLLLSAPATLKLGEEIQGHILSRHRPDFLRVPNSNTGAAVGAGSWRCWWSMWRLKLLAKLRVPGYQPYERLGAWLRQELAAVVREVLLHPQALDRGVYHPDGIRTVVGQHIEGRRNHTFLLLALMIFELGARLLLDRSPASVSHAL